MTKVVSTSSAHRISVLRSLIVPIESPIATAAAVSATITLRVSACTSWTWARSASSCSSNAPFVFAGSSAPYPESRIASTNCSAEIAPGSNDTVALFSIRFTVASATPGVRASVRCTRAWQAAQVMPVTGMTRRDAAGVSVVAVFVIASALGASKYTPWGYSRRSQRRSQLDDRGSQSAVA